MKRILNKYFDNPVKFDFAFAVILVLLFKKFVLNNVLELPSNDNVRDLASETVTILLTLSGFILTFLTVLVSLKLDATKLNGRNEESLSLIEKFCNSGLYFETTTIFKNSIKEIIFSAILIYLVRLFSTQLPANTMYLFTIGGIIILILTILRNLWILGRILDMQKPDENLQ